MVKTTLPYPDGDVAIRVQTLAAEIVDGAQAGVRCAPNGDRLTIGTATGNDLVLADPTASRFHAELTRDERGIRVHDVGSTNGTFVGGVRVKCAWIRPDSVLRIGQTNVRVVEAMPVDVALHKAAALGGLLGNAPSMRRLMAQIERVARSEAPVLVIGESGTGKEKIARALHDLGPRAKKPFVTIDCGSLAPTLVASELFGHEKGAFTGADRRHVGAFERASGGTIFLDEIGELPTELQPALLGALERGTLHRVGGSEDVVIDVRIVAATNRDLREAVNAGDFRLDLYYRLAVVSLDVPPLRERTEDLPLLIDHFLQSEGWDGTASSVFDAEYLQQLRAHYWPGNVRELRNLVEATLALGEPPPATRPSRPAATTGPVIALEPLLDLGYRAARDAVLREFEQAFVDHVLDRAEGNVARAAREAHMDRSHLFELIRRRGGRAPD